MIVREEKIHVCGRRACQLHGITASDPAIRSNSSIVIGRF
jgi:hypothetical protein